jgi:hypothetical protein
MEHHDQVLGQETMRVVERYYDETCPDGFPMIFVMEDGTLVFTSEKYGRHVQSGEDVLLLDSCYKSGFKNRELQRALEEIPADIPLKVFGPIQYMLYHIVTERPAFLT